MSYTVLAFYKFTSFAASESLKADLLAQMKVNEVKGTIIIASEGINGTICAEPSNSEQFFNYLKQYAGLEDLTFKQSHCDFNPFDKAKVKLRTEIVTFGISGIDPSVETGEHVKPKEWNQLISEEDVVVIDVRNDYEVKLGTFKNAINPSTLNFRDFPSFVEQHLKNQEHRKIAMFCTGGIRCEKSTAYLKAKGFERVYQLDGGILNYCANTPADESLWDGHCFVFDNRVAVDSKLANLPVGSIDVEWKNKNRQGENLDTSF
ncbi:MAG: rhodanese-related sulfurtransferase [Legionella sp.]|nr:rhodanese-related sulfurtransferase [Legionella sp.]